MTNRERALAVVAERENAGTPPWKLAELIEKALDAAVAEAVAWRPMETAPRDGTRILVNFKPHGALTVAWTTSESLNIPIWCVNDFKFGPYPLRGYSRDGELGWMPLPHAENPQGPAASESETALCNSTPVVGGTAKMASEGAGADTPASAEPLLTPQLLRWIADVLDRGSKLCESLPRAIELRREADRLEGK